MLTEYRLEFITACDLYQIDPTPELREHIERLHRIILLLENVNTSLFEVDRKGKLCIHDNLRESVWQAITA